MVNSSKVLTVSYGTFSCTLEGFDDSFGMMRAIAEYFRDLAADDRYFGAEPPIPDAEMLARVAEREIERRVEARMERGGIILRPSQESQVQTGAAASMVPAAGAVAAAVAAAVPEAVAAQSQPRPETTALLNDASGAPRTDVADAIPGDGGLLAQPEPPVADAGPAPEDVDTPNTAQAAQAPEAEAEAESGDAQDWTQEDDDPVMEDAAAEQDVDIAAFMAASSDQAPIADVAEAVAEDVAEDMAPAADQPSDSVMAKLQRIRAVVSQNDQAEAETDFVEDEHAETLDDGVGDDLDRAMVGALLKETAEDHGARDALAEEDADTALDFVADAVAPDSVAMAELEDDGYFEDEAESSDASDALLKSLISESAEATEDDAFFADDEDEDTEGLSALDELDALDGAEDTADEDWSDDIWDEGTDEDEADAAIAAEAEEDTPEPVAAEPAKQPLRLTAPIIRATVKKISRTDADGALRSGLLVEETRVEPARAEVPMADSSTLLPEDEDDLARELAALEAEIASEEAAMSGLDAAEADWDDDASDDWDATAEAEDDEDDDDWDATAEADADEDDWDATAEAGDEDDDWDDDDEWDALGEEDAQTDGPFEDPKAASDDWDDEDEDDDDSDVDIRPAASAAPQNPVVDEDDWDDYDEEDAEEDRKWAEAEARIKAEQAAQEAEAKRQAEISAMDDEDEDDDDEDFAAAPPVPVSSKARDLEDMEATIDRLARESVRKTVKLTSPARVMLTENKVEESDTSVSRLMSQTNSELREPEGNRRRSAIAHLRAAVAATRADRILGRRRDEEQEKAAYREDLQDAVRPRRPQASGSARSERPKVDLPPASPLQLVAEQRISAEEKAKLDVADAGPVLPRRVGARAEDDRDDDDEDSGFAQFAASVGAHELPDLLEAAAAYLSFVEGREQFSRPQLMSKVRQVEDEESSREDRLLSFGQLLRDGKIQKTRGGRFTASDSIGFHPGKRATG